VPGTYTVRLTADGKTETAPLVVKMDPRVKVPAADLEALHAAQVKMAASLDALAKADLEAHSLMEQISVPENASAENASPENAPLTPGLAPYSRALKLLLDGTKEAGEKGRPGMDDVNGEATQLYGQLQQADAAPTKALLDAAAHNQEEGEEAVRGWEEFQQKQLPAINEQLRNAHRPAVNLNQRPGSMPEGGDED
jgi:hypothetical protein